MKDGTRLPNLAAYIKYVRMEVRRERVRVANTEEGTWEANVSYLSVAGSVVKVSGSGA